MPHHHRHCVYCGKLCGDARACVKHSPLVYLDPHYAPPASFYPERKR